MQKQLSATIIILIIVWTTAVFTLRALTPTTAALSVTQTISQEPLLGGTIVYDITIINNGTVYVTDKGYNLAITNTLPVGLNYISANPSPAFVETQDDGSIRLFWDNIVDLEVQESFTLSVAAALDSGLTPADTFINTVSATVNSAPDNSGSWISASDQISASPQAIDIEMVALQSTADEQATGAGEYDSDADWPYQYRVTMQNNNVGSTDNVTATAILPPGVAYMGNASISPTIALQNDGSLTLSWALNTLTVAEYSNPIEITFDVAIPYQYRTISDTAAALAPYAGPMSGSIIAEDAVMESRYEATGTYSNIATSDGTTSTPADDTPVTVTAEYLTVSKSATPNMVGIGDTVTFDIDFYVSEYYTLTNVTLVDVLPDGLTYVTANQPPILIEEDTPDDGQTTVTWAIDATSTTPGNSGTIAMQATVDAAYEAAPYTGQPVVSGDVFTNRATINGDWEDVMTNGRFATVIPDTSIATIATHMPAFSKEVWDADSSSWTDFTHGFTGDSMTFRLTYDAASNINAKEIIIRDFLPRGMSFVDDSDSYSNSGDFADSTTCASAPTTPTIGTLNGLQYLEWPLCNTEQGLHWQVILNAVLGDTPNVQPGWLVANFGKLSGQNSYAAPYSLRDSVNVDYTAPELTLTKTAVSSTDLIAGDTVIYTIAVTNNGDADAYNIVLTDTVPPDLLIANTGGNGVPTTSDYVTTSGDPSSGAGGILEWTSVAVLAPAQTQTYTYTAVIPTGLHAGQQMSNLASVAYNSRADNAGHQWAATTDINDANTDNATVYIHGATVTKSVRTPNSDFPARQATIGETVHWTITATVPTGVIAYWPVIEENNLPSGFDYVAGSTIVTGATIDTTNHVENPIESNVGIDLRWFLETVDNSSGVSDYTFTVEFDTLITGVRQDSINTNYYTNNSALNNADNDAYIGWYDDASGYNGQGFAYDGLSTNYIDRRSPQADADVTIRQPNMTLMTGAIPAPVIGAGEIITVYLTSANQGYSPAYDVVLTNTLPAELEFIETVATGVTYPTGVPTHPFVITDTNTVGSSDLTYEIDVIYEGVIWYIELRARVNTDVSADSDLVNNTSITMYSSQAGTPPDTNSDTLSDQRVYTGPTDSFSLHTPNGSIQKTGHVADELTFGSNLAYTLTVPADPINATLYNVVVTDTLDSYLQIDGVTNGSATGNIVTATFASIPPNQQETILIQASLPITSSAVDGQIISNQAMVAYDDGGVKTSPIVAYTVVAPALVVEKQANVAIVSETDILTYTLSIANVGGGRADGLIVSELLPAEFSYVDGSGSLNESPLADPIAGSWSLPDLAGETAHTIVFQAQANSASAGEAYVNNVVAVGYDSQGSSIPADNSVRVLADTDSDDTATATVYGPLTCDEESTHVAFEDLKGSGWADWDYNDLVVRIDTEQCVTPGDELAVVNIAYDVIARGAGYDHEFIHDLPISGGGQVYLTVRNANGDIVRQTSSVFTSDVNISIFENTKQSLPPDDGFVFTNTKPEQDYYIDGYTASLTAVIDNASENPTFLLPPLPWDPYIHVYNTNEEVHLIIPGHMNNSQHVNDIHDPTSPMIGFDLPLAQTFDSDWDWMVEHVGIWRGYPDYVNYIGSGSTTNLDWFDNANSDSEWLWQYAPLFSRSTLSENDPPASRYVASPVATDLDGDGTVEIVVGNLLSNQVERYNEQGQNEWLQNVNGGVKAAAAVADLVPSVSGLEIIVGSSDGYVYAMHQNGDHVTGWPARVGAGDTYYEVIATPAIADLDEDDALDVVIPGGNGRLYAFNANGSLKWDVSIGEVANTYGSQIINSSPVIVDLDGDGDLEIVVGSYDKKMYAFDHEGNLLWSYETGDIILSTPAAADIDPDSTGKEIVFGSGDSYLYLLNKDGSLIWKRPTGWTMSSSPLVIDLDEDNDLEILIGRDSSGNGGMVLAWHHDGGLVSGWPQSTGSSVFDAPVAGDIDGDGKIEIVAGADDAKVYAWEVDGTAVSGWPKATTLSVKGSPALANLDGDPELEIIVGDFDGNILIWGRDYYELFLPLIMK